jgi:hypothetical protein
MKLLLSFFALYLISGSVAAANEIKYELRDLRPQGMSQYSLPGTSFRHYLRFQNELGMHYFLYEDSVTHPPLREIAMLHSALAVTEFKCAADIVCQAKAFCTGDCRDMYYEFSNLSTPAGAGENRCRIQAFSCDRSGQRVPSSMNSPMAPPSVASPVSSAPGTSASSPPTAQSQISPSAAAAIAAGLAGVKPPAPLPDPAHSNFDGE